MVENVPHLEFTEVVLINCTIVKKIINKIFVYICS